MAIYHCSIKIISRGKGKSAVAAAAYRSGETLTNDHDGVTHDFTRKKGIIHTEILLPAYAPPKFADRSVLWNSVEKIEKARNSQLAREVEVALPVELDREQQIRLIREYVEENFVSAGMCADIAIHDKEDGNPHAHVMLTMRPFEESGEWGAKSKKEYVLDKDGQRVKLKSGTFKSRKISTVDWNDQGKAEVWRKAWADVTNRYLAEQNCQERVDHRSYERQGSDKISTLHMGAAATQMERRGVETERGEQNKEIRTRNRLVMETQRQISRLKEWIRQMTLRVREKEQPPIDPIRSNPFVTLLEHLNRAMQESNASRSHHGKVRDLQMYAKAISFLQEHGIETIEQFQDAVSEIKKNHRNANKCVKRIEKILHEQRELVEQSEKYLKYRPVYKEYRQMKPRKQKKYYDQHVAELTLYQTAERYLKERLGNDNVLNLKGWKAEIAALAAEKKRLYEEAYALKAEAREAETIKKYVEQAVRKNRTRTKARSNRGNIEL